MKANSVVGLFCLTLIGRPMVASSVEIIGHRGAAHVAPENTLISVQTAWKLGADAAEIDIHLTKDRRIVAIHDDTTKRTAGVDFKVSETTAADLRKLDVGRFKAERFAGEKIPFLEDILATIPPGRKLYIEIKCGKEVLPLLKEMLVSSGKTDQIVIIGFDAGTVSISKRFMPNVPTYWLKGTDKEKETNKPIPHGKELIEMVLDRKLDGLDVNYAGITKDFVEAIKASGMRLYTWTVNDLDEAKRLQKLGVDGITTDRPGWLREQLAKDNN